MTKLAARLTDMHVCPMSDGPKPHVGGPITAPGCPSVLIAGMPAARVGDVATCAGPPDAIVRGSSTVIIGGQPAARMGDLTAHGGRIVTGAPTVLIGDAGAGSGAGGAPAVDAFGAGAVAAAIAAAAAAVYLAYDAARTSESYSEGIRIEGSRGFRRRTRATLDRLADTETGKSVIKAIGASGKRVTIRETAEANGRCSPKSREANRRPDGSPGSGSDSTVSFNPDFQPGGLPNDIVLGHELIHAQHNAEGVRETGKTRGVKDTERKTVGLPPFPDEGNTENALRDDYDLPKRTSY